MRRLPVFLLLDTSGFMTGELIEQLKNGVQMLVSALRQDPYALETAYLSVITFDSIARETVPLTKLAAFQVPEISDSSAMSKFFKWVSASVSSNSKAVETAGKEVEGLDQLPPPPPEIQIVT